MAEEQRKVVLRAERDEVDSRFLEAYLVELGNLHIDGQDLGPGTSGDDVLDVLERSWSGAGSYALEKFLRDTAFPLQRCVW